MVFDELYIGFLIATTILMAIPGPNVTLVIANSIAHGYRYGFMTTAGTLCAMAIQLVVTVLGMAALLAFMANWFEVIRWAGVLYLLYLGMTAILAKPDEAIETNRQKKSLRYIFWEGFFISLTNPKTLLFFGAFFPQFVRPEGDLTGQLTILAITAITIALIVDCTWCLLANSMRPVISKHTSLKDKIAGGFLISAAALLAFARKA